MRGVMVRRIVMAAVAWTAVACRTGDMPPVPLDTAHEACGFCRMVISDARFASQIVGPRADPQHGWLDGASLAMTAMLSMVVWRLRP